MGLIKPCCRFHPNEQESGFDWDGVADPFLVFEGKGFEVVRQKMDSGQEVLGCRTCTMEEKAGVESMRQKVISRNELTSDSEVELEGLEIGFSRVCNLACVSCNGHFSTKWEKYEEQLLGQKPRYQNHRFEWSKLPNDKLKGLKSLKITGGEPLLAPEFFKFIERLVVEGYSQNIEIEVFSNCTIKPKLSLLRHLESFKRVEINLSIDSIEHRNDYIRFHSEWSLINQVAQVWRMASLALDNFHIGFAVTVSALNVLSLPELYDWIYSNFKDMEIHNQILAEPTYMSLYHLDAKTIAKIKTLFDQRKNEFLNRWHAKFHHPHLFREIEQTFLSVQESKKEIGLIEELEKLDSVRGTNWRTAFPDVAAVFLESS